MYTRDESYQSNVPDNYAGIAMKDECRNECPPPRRDECRNECPPPRREECQMQKCNDGGIFSSLLSRLGLGGIDSTELIILLAALLLLSSDDKCDDNSYIWVLLLLLLVIK